MGIELMHVLLHQFQPTIYKHFTDIVASLKASDANKAKQAFLSIEPKMLDPRGGSGKVDTSIDYAIMMRLTADDYKGDTLGKVQGYCIPGTFYWMDIGSWNALRQVCPADAAKNVIVGSVKVEDSEGVIVYQSP